MKGNAKRIITLIISALLVIVMTLSMSSCNVYFNILEDIMNGNIPDIGDSDGDKVTPPDKDNDNDKNDDDDGTVLPDGEISDFYPDSGTESTDNVSALRKTLLSTVIVTANFTYSPSAGSGVIYQIDKDKGDAYIITNYHVVYSDSYGLCESAAIYLYGMELDGYKIPATFIGGSVTYDIAVLKVEGSEVLKNSYATAITLGNSEKVRVFDTVYAVGNPEGYGISASKGIVSVASEQLEMTGADGSDVELRVIRIDAAINTGNSGGGLYDDDGKLVGVVCAKRIGSDIDNMAYAIPSNLAKNVADNIIVHCNGKTDIKLKRALLGITITSKIMGIVVDPDTGDIYEAEIVEVAEVSNGSVVTGIIEVGDVINSISVDGNKIDVTMIHHLPEHMLRARVGSEIVINLTRGDETFDVNVEITPELFNEVK